MAASNTMKRYNLRPRNTRGKVTAGVKYTAIHLRQLPPEIREMIFLASLSRHKRKTPALLKALRADPELYAEAIRVYYRMNEFGLGNTEDLGWFSALKGEVFAAIRKISVTTPTNKAFHPTLFDALVCLPNLTSLKIISPNTASLVQLDIIQLFLPESAITSEREFRYKFLTKLHIEVPFKTGAKNPNGLPLFNLLDAGIAVHNVRIVRKGFTSLFLMAPVEDHIWHSGDVYYQIVWEAEKAKTLWR